MDNVSFVRYLLICVMALVGDFAVKAVPVDSVAARETALQFLSSAHGRNLGSRAPELKLVHRRTSAACDSVVADYYIFTCSGDNGFVIVAGDDRARRVLAYGDSPIDLDNVPGNVQWLLDGYTEQMEYLFLHPEEPHVASSTHHETSIVSQMLTTRWGQRTPYRNQCPQVDGTPCVTGCVATAMAQVMNYWKFPSILPESPGYTTATLKLQVPALPAASVNWNQMLDTYGNAGYSQEQGDAVALLMRYCGQACKMDYMIASSSAFVTDQLKAFKQFGYNEDASFVLREDYSDEEWHAMIMDDLLADCPVIYVGSNNAGSVHNFVLDGFDGSKYHVNWGWDGMYDGYYELDAMDGGGYRPTHGHNMLHGIYPNDEVPNGDFVIDNIYYKRIGMDWVEVTYRDEDYNSYSGDVVIPDTVSLFGVSYIVKAIGDNAFRACTGINSVSIPATVTRIGKSAFMRSGIKSIVIPDGVEMINASAFMQCRDLTSVLMSNSVTEIRDNTFAYCGKLTGLVLPLSVRLIGGKAFDHSGLESFIVPDSVFELRTSAFQNCVNLKSVQLSVSLAAIGASAFQGCSALTSIDIPESVATIGDEAFMDCTALKRVKMGGQLSAVGKSVFKGCTALNRSETLDMEAWCKIAFTDEYSNPLSCAHHLWVDDEEIIEVVIPDTVSHLNSFALCNAVALASVTFPAGLKSVGASAFKGCNNLKRLDVSDFEAWLQIDFADQYANPVARGCRVYLNGQEVAAELEIPNTVTKIGKYAFMGCSWLQGITIPASVREIGENAFSTCYYLKSLYIHDIDAWCRILFHNSSSNPMCHNVQYLSLLRVFLNGVEITTNQLEIPLSTTSIKDYAFANSRFSGFTFHEGMDSIGRGAFINNRITELVLPDGMKVLGDNAFNSCSSLARVEFPSTLDSIGNQAFYNTALTSVKLPDGLSALGTRAFAYCWNLVEADLGKSIPRIPDSSFSACYSLSHIIIPETVTEIGDDAFAECAFAEMPTSNSIHTIGNNAFALCKNMTEAVIGDHVTSIGEGVFRNCSRLKTVAVGNSIQAIKPFSFYSCGALEHVTVGCNVDTIDYGAFLGCHDITGLTCLANEPPRVITNSSYGCFEDKCFNNTVLYVPVRSVDAYKKDNLWKRFKNISGVCLNDVNGDVNCDGEVNIADVNAVIRDILTGQGNPDLDVSGDGEVNIADVNAIISIILKDNN